MSFWDSSAIVPLCVFQPNSNGARSLSRRLPGRFVWRECVVEVSSAFARLRREGLIDEAAHQRSLLRLKQLERNWNVVGQHSRIVELARTFPALYGLKAMDSLQLAAALVWCKEHPKNMDFVSGDGRLLKAAESVGFTIHELA